MTEFVMIFSAIPVEMLVIESICSKNIIITKASLNKNLIRDTKTKAAPDSILIFCRLIIFENMVSSIRLISSIVFYFKKIETIYIINFQNYS